MKTKSMVLAFFMAGLCCCPAFAQQSRLDMLMQEVEAYQKQDSTRLRLLCSLSEELEKRDPKSTLSYCDEAISLARELQDRNYEMSALNLKGRVLFVLGNIENSELTFAELIRISALTGDSIMMASGYFNLGISHLRLGTLDKARGHLHQAESIYTALGNKDGLAVTLENLGIVFSLLGNYPQALSCHLRAQSLFEELGAKDRLANNYMNIGNVYDYCDEYEKAREYYGKALSLYEQAENMEGIAYVKGNIAISYYNHPDRSLAFRYHIEALEAFAVTGNNHGMMLCNSNMAHLLNNLDNDDFDTYRDAGIFKGIDQGANNRLLFALQILNRNMELLQTEKDWVTYAFTYNLMGESYMHLNEPEQALQYSFRSLHIADSIKMLDIQKDALQVISKIYEQAGKYDSAFYYFQKYIIVRDSLDNDQIRKEIQRKEIQYEYEAREKELRSQKELSDLNSRIANELVQQQLLKIKTSEQAILLQSKELDISRKEQDLSHLAYLRKMAELQVVDLEKQDKERQLTLLSREHELANQKVHNRSLQRNISYGVIVISILFLLYVFRNFRRQRRYNRQLRALNAEISNVNKLLQGSNDELSSTLDQLKLTQAQLIETEKQKEKETIRRRISQDMHDDISSGLTKIVWLCEMAGRQVAQADYRNVTGVINRISDSSRSAVERIGEIIWAIDPDRDNLEGFYAYLRTYIMEYFEPTNYQVSIDFPEKKEDTRFNPDVKRTLFVVIKEALHNIVKHAKGDAVEVNFRINGPLYHISIIDNGKGLDVVPANNYSSGMRNMKLRMENIGGTFSIVSQEIQGTHIRLEGPVAGV